MYNRERYTSMTNEEREMRRNKRRETYKSCHTFISVPLENQIGESGVSLEVSNSSHLEKPSLALEGIVTFFMQYINL